MAKKDKQNVEASNTTVDPAVPVKGKKEKRDKQKKEKSGQSTLSSTDNTEKVAPSFSLFGGKSDTQLDDVFSKGAAFAIAPAQPVASSSKLPPPATVAGQDATEDKKRPRKRKSRTPSSVPAEIALQLPATTSALTQSAGGPSETDKQRKRKRRSVSAAGPANGAIEGEADLNDEEDDDDDGQELVHETLQKKQRKPRTGKYVPQGESAEDRDRRTIFVGNISLETLKSKSGLSKLKAHILTFVPGAKVESARFRSVPFATPTSGDAEGDEAAGAKRAKREKERAAAWKAQQEVLKSGDKKDKEELDTAASYIDAKGKRKVAFIKKEFHAEADSCNAYVVFAHPPPDRPANLPPILEPFEAAQQALKADGSSLDGHTIRVDVVRPMDGVAQATTNLKKRDAWTAGADPKKSVFVGGVDYAAKEEDLRAFFEELIKKERGARSDGEKYVTSVRVVRDKQTQMGKGFAYVHFIDTESVDEVLGIEDAKLKFAKKPLRIQRAKTLPSNKPTPAKAAPSTGKDPKSANGKPAKPIAKTNTVKTPAGPIPKGNPLLGEKIKDLSKEERKVAKSADSDRQARRLAKKKARGKMSGEAEKGAVKLLPSKAEKARGKKIVAKKSRVRSSNALAKMKGSRA